MYLNGQVLSLLILQSNACKRKYTAVNKKFSYLVDNKYSFVKTKLHVCLSYNPRMAIKKSSFVKPQFQSCLSYNPRMALKKSSFVKP